MANTPANTLVTSPLSARLAEDRVRQVTDPAVTRELDRRMAERVAAYAGRSPEAVELRLRELEREWDIERWLEANASTLAFASTALALFHRRGWLALTAVVTGFLFQHAVSGWCPPIPVFRRLGIRTRREIEAEIYALKALRGDFSGVAAAPTDAVNRAHAALTAVGR